MNKNQDVDHFDFRNAADFVEQIMTAVISARYATGKIYDVYGPGVRTQREKTVEHLRNAELCLQDCHRMLLASSIQLDRSNAPVYDTLRPVPRDLFADLDENGEPIDEDLDTTADAAEEDDIDWDVPAPHEPDRDKSPVPDPAIDIEDKKPRKKIHGSIPPIPVTAIDMVTKRVIYTYPSISEAARRQGVSHSVVRTRMDKGIPYDGILYREATPVEVAASRKGRRRTA